MRRPVSCGWRTSGSTSCHAKRAPTEPVAYTNGFRNLPRLTRGTNVPSARALEEFLQVRTLLHSRAKVSGLGLRCARHVAKNYDGPVRSLRAGV